MSNNCESSNKLCAESKMILPEFCVSVVSYGKYVVVKYNRKIYNQDRSIQLSQEIRLRPNGDCVFQNGIMPEISALSLDMAKDIADTYAIEHYNTIFCCEDGWLKPFVYCAI